jgi:hypothetical protein
MAKEPKKPKPARFTLGSLYLAAGLVVGFLVLTKMIPAMNTIVDDKAVPRQSDSGGWHAIVIELSRWTSSHQQLCIAAIAIVAIAGIVLPFLIRPMRYVVWAAALAIFLLDVALVGGGYGHVITGLLEEANDLNR